MNEQFCQPLVTVVIPFFQNEKGLLFASVESILNQKNYSNFEVIVVDDGSPVSASTELKELISSSNKITILEQENAGPGAARNKGLDSASSETVYVAFMDSDDRWECDFLHIAVETLEAGYDLFFANTLREGIESTRFEWDQKKNLALSPEDHLMLDDQYKTFEFQGDFFDYALVRSNILSTSATIFRRECYPGLRFDPELFNGQDRLFKLTLSQKINKTAFSARVLVKEHKGLNIFGSASWGTSKSLVLLSNYIKLSKTILKQLTLNPGQQSVIKSQLSESRYSFVASVVHLIKGEEKIDWRLVGKTIKNDPSTVAFILPGLVKILGNKLNRQQA